MCHRQGFDAAGQQAGRLCVPAVKTSFMAGICFDGGQWSRLQFLSGEPLTQGVKILIFVVSKIRMETVKIYPPMYTPGG